MLISENQGETWTKHIISGSFDKEWKSITFGNGLFISVASSGTSTQKWAMSSIDGIHWILDTTPGSNYWISVIYSTF